MFSVLFCGECGSELIDREKGTEVLYCMICGNRVDMTGMKIGLVMANKAKEEEKVSILADVLEQARKDAG